MCADVDARGKYGESRALSPQSMIAKPGGNALVASASIYTSAQYPTIYKSTTLHTDEYHTRLSTGCSLWIPICNHGHNSRDACCTHRNATYCWPTARRQSPHHLFSRTRTTQNTRHSSRIRHASMRRSPHNLRSSPFKCRLNFDHKHNLGQGAPRIG